MISLAEKGLSMVMITDKEENKVIDLWRGDNLTGYFAFVRTDPTSDGNESPDRVIIFQEQLKYRVVLATNERKPRLESLSFSPGKHDSYITGEKDMSERNQFLSDSQVRSFCLRVFNLYQKSQNLAQLQPQNNVG